MLTVVIVNCYENDVISSRQRNGIIINKTRNLFRKSSVYIFSSCHSKLILQVKWNIGIYFYITKLNWCNMESLDILSSYCVLWYTGRFLQYLLTLKIKKPLVTHSQCFHLSWTKICFVNIFDFYIIFHKWQILLNHWF